MTDHNTPWVDEAAERERQDLERENELWDDNVRHWEQDERDRVEGHE